MLTEIQIQAELDRLEAELTAEGWSSISIKAYDSLFLSGDKSIYYRHGYLNGLKNVLQKVTKTIKGKKNWL